MNNIFLAIGIFDGVHVGHRYLLTKLITDAKNKNALSMVLTFNPHPKQVLNIQPIPKMIYSIYQRQWLLKSLGVNIIEVESFTKKFSQLSPVSFIKQTKDKIHNLQRIYVGNDFHFGCNNSGDVTILRNICNRYNIDVIVTENQLEYNENNKISSTNIRHYLQNIHHYNYNFNRINLLLGQKYFMIGNIIKNVFEIINYSDNLIILPNGVYNCTLNKKINCDVNIKEGLIKIKDDIRDMDNVVIEFNDIKYLNV